MSDAILMTLEKKQCTLCLRELRIESFPRLGSNKEWIGRLRVCIPRNAFCSECVSIQVKQKRNGQPLEKLLSPHVDRCHKRSQKRNPSGCTEGITVNHVKTAYIEHKGICPECNSEMDFQITGLGFNLCYEDREALGAWPSCDKLLTIDRVDASQPHMAYFDKITQTSNFALLCFGCNKEKFYQSDAIGQLAARNAEQARIISCQYDQILNLKKASQSIGKDQSLELCLALQQIKDQEESLVILTRMAKENFVQPIIIQDQQWKAMTSIVTPKITPKSKKRKSIVIHLSDLK